MSKLRTATVATMVVALLGSAAGTAAAGHLPVMDPAEVAQWTPDRQAPSSYGSVDVDGSPVVEMTIDGGIAEDRSEGYYRTEGLSRDIDATDAVSVDLYLDEAWQDEAVRAGLWARTSGQENWAILEFANVEECPTCQRAASVGDTHEGFRIWDPELGWKAHLDTAFEAGTWVTLTVRLDSDEDRWLYLIDGVPVGTAEALGGQTIDQVKLNAYNFGGEPVGLDTDGYTVRYRGVATGSLFDPESAQASDSLAVDVAYDEQLDVSLQVDGPTQLMADEAGQYSVDVSNDGTARDRWLEGWNLGLEVGELDSLAELELAFCTDATFTTCTAVDDYEDIELAMTDDGVVQVLGSTEEPLEPGFSTQFYFTASFANEGHYVGNVYALQLN